MTEGVGRRSKPRNETSAFTLSVLAIRIRPFEGQREGECLVAPAPSATTFSGRFVKYGSGREPVGSCLPKADVCAYTGTRRRMAASMDARVAEVARERGVLERPLAVALTLFGTLPATLDTVLLAPVRARFRLRLASISAFFQALLGAAPRERGKQKGGQGQAHRDSLVHRLSKERSG
jgi:hypothetical protein